MTCTSSLTVFSHFIFFTGPCLPDGPRGRYPPNMYHGPPYEPPMSNNGWHYPVRPVNHREMGPHRPYPDAPVPMGSRGTFSLIFFFFFFFYPVVYKLIHTSMLMM